MTDPALPDRCILQNRMFTALGEPAFRRAEADGTPVMAVRLGEREAALPLQAVQREFGIADDEPDGRMLARIAEALDYVSALRLGDPLPSEVVSGDASWTPDPVHQQLAATRLRLQLVDWLAAGAEQDRRALTPESLLQVADDPNLRAQVQQAVARAASELGFPGADAVLCLLEEIAQELAYIEALRDRLLGRMTAAIGKIERLAASWRGDAHQSESLRQVRRLGAIALKTTRTRFEELDAQTGEVMAALRNAESQRAFIRSHRDWLYRSLRAWEPILLQWEAAGAEWDQGMVALIARTYQFLAPRFMPATEWLSSRKQTAARPAPPRMVW